MQGLQNKRTLVSKHFAIEDYMFSVIHSMICLGNTQGWLSCIQVVMHFCFSLIISAADSAQAIKS